MDDNHNRLLAGRYEVGDLIGRGGMAEVHIGRDTRLGRTVAIKVLRSDLARDPAFQVRFRREAQSAAALNHPAIVAVYDTGEDVSTDPAGQVVRQPFIVMEYIEGRTVRDLLRGGNALEIDEAVDVTIGVLSALQYSHQAGIVHRDIKPANVMITPTGAVKVMDFGIARALADSAATMTQTQTVVGTAQYLSPEQARGEEVDARSDLYSTGCLMYEMLTGRPPFQGDSAVAVAYQHVQEQPAPPSSIAADIPAALDAITLKALAKDREMRYSTASEFRGDLETFKRGGTIAATTTPTAAATEVLAPVPVAVPTIPPTAAATPTSAGWAPVAGAGGVGAAVADPEDPDDEDENSTRRAWIIAILSVLGVAALALIIWLLFIKPDGAEPTDTPSPTVASVAVPDIVEGALDEDQARQKLRDANLDWLDPSTQEASDTVAAGRVIRYDPASGTPVEVGTKVGIVISSGPGAIPVPDVTGLSVDDATRELNRAGFTNVSATTTSKDDSLEAKDKVDSTNPAIGQQVDKTTEIKLILSSGNMIVPNVVGMSQADATSALKAKTFIVTPENDVRDDGTPGEVSGQDPPESSVVQQGATVTIKVITRPEQVAVPPLVGLSLADAQTALQDAGFTSNVVDEVYSPTVPKGSVVSSEPRPGQKVNAGSEVDLVVSKGPEPTTPPPTTSTPTGTSGARQDKD